jgi:hypothetical protein
VDQEDQIYHLIALQHLEFQVKDLLEEQLYLLQMSPLQLRVVVVVQEQLVEMLQQLELLEMAEAEQARIRYGHP